jgi:hypothetical protein
MSIAEAFKQAIKNAFIHSIFLKRDKEFILKALNTKVHGSNNVNIVPPIQSIEVERIDDTHDKVTFGYDDYAFVGVITWKHCANGINFVFMNIE